MNKVNIQELITQYLFEGKKQTEISKLLKENGIIPNSLSSVEKEINKIRAKHKAKTLFHLGAILTLKKYIFKK